MKPISFYCYKIYNVKFYYLISCLKNYSYIIVIKFGQSTRYGKKVIP